jgi:cysteine-rich repeat protein
MTPSFTIRITTPLALLSLTACPLSIVVGHDPQDDAGGDESGVPGSTSAPSDPTTTAGPGVCGDGVVDDGEQCDDGDDDAHDGCDPVCARTGALEWTFRDHALPDSGDGAAGVAIDASGRIIVVGNAGARSLVLALDPAGDELWRRTYDGGGGFTDVVVDGGTIYILDLLGQLRSLTAAGDDIWLSGPAESGTELRGLALTPAGLYVAGGQASDAGTWLILRRHRLADGMAEWINGTPDDMQAFGLDVAVAGDRLVVVGGGAFEDEAPFTLRALVAVFAEDGDLLSLDVGEQGREWNAVAPTADGGLVLGGFGPTDDVVVRRLGPDLEAVWTTYEEDSPGDVALGVAVGPGDAIAVAGMADTDGPSALARRYTGAGELVWTSIFAGTIPVRLDSASAVAFGPDAIVAVGHETLSPKSQDITGLWVRRFALDAP